MLFMRLKKMIRIMLNRRRADRKEKIMRCSICGNDMFLLLTSYVCETCEAPPIDSMEIEYDCDFTAAAPIGKAKRSSGTQVGPTVTAAYAYEKIGGVGFYYDPEYAKKQNLSGADFQIGPSKDYTGVNRYNRYAFSKKEIRKILEWMHLIPTTFTVCIGGVHFRYSSKTDRLDIAGYSFSDVNTDKIHKFFESFLVP